MGDYKYLFRWCHPGQPFNSVDLPAGQANNGQRLLMKFTRRSFLSAAAGASALSAMPPALAAQPPQARSPSTLDAQGLALEEAGAKPVLRLKGLNAPVIIESIELLRKGRGHFLRVRSKDGAEGLSVDNGRMDVLHPILSRLVIPYFSGDDDRGHPGHSLRGTLPVR